ncbi:MAG: hypothetical protein ACJ76V_15730 [Thermoleophilaceae bacterium]
MRVFRKLSTLAAAAVIPVAVGVPAAQGSVRTTVPLVRTFSGATPDGPSRNPAVSGDARIARAMAYESDASNIVRGDTNGATDVFVVHRAPGYGRNGTPWNIGRTELASRGLGGAPANARSYDAELDGDSHDAPQCVAFISEASNLVHGDTNGVADAFVYFFRAKKTIRVSVNSRGEQANGASTDVSVEGDCDRVAFTSNATNLALDTGDLGVGAKPPQPAGPPNPAGVRQVYVHFMHATKLDKDLVRQTILASRSTSGRAGDQSSFDVDFAASGKALVFTSLARLDPADRNSHEDVYERTLERRFRHLGHGKGVQVVHSRTDLVSHGGNASSTDASASDDGRHVAYETLASNLLPGDANGVSDVVEADMAGGVPRQRWVSRSQGIGQPGNGASQDPDISGAADFVLFDSDATNLLPSNSHKDPNGVRDVFLWNRPTSNASLESRTANNLFLATPSMNPATSSHGNYVLFESNGMVYLRYEGPE